MVMQPWKAQFVKPQHALLGDVCGNGMATLQAKQSQI
jgi:hypothetical protein